ncbi:MAG: hypothetical protein HKL90_02975 [Elusimicrobia bacterium]|nr:hypothetical protein [Elusimicrobiota bacterium]
MADVPLFADRSDQCGPAAMAGVLRYWGKPVDMPSLKHEIYRGPLGGSLTVDLFLAAQAHGMTARLVDGGLKQVEEELNAGHPLVAYIAQGFAFLPVGHFMVLTGYDPQRRGFYANTDVRKNAFFPESRFARQWNRGDRWALLVLPPPP